MVLSVLPLMFVLGVFMVLGFVLTGSKVMIGLGLVVVVLTGLGWLSDLNSDQVRWNEVGYVTPWGMLLFIGSELMLFLGVLGTSLFLESVGSVELGWVNFSMSGFGLDFMGVGLFGSVILLSSGVTMTWAHGGLLGGSGFTMMSGLVLTTLLGGLFMLVMWAEWVELILSWDWGRGGSVFFVTTALHGSHVTIGLFVIILVIFNLSQWGLECIEFSLVEASMWYWHFVDLVWLGV
uniref:Cytochrome c oxidase subunit 3 n=1 Tax=Pallisentis celatus TaxID=935648 RepID=V5IXA7_PALCE|nr:cytochrome c oxidase subunit III [Pallisentis celatus]AFK50142.1 cytochrome c oxidase subunit III [Pallisentis celatus]